MEDQVSPVEIREWIDLAERYRVEPLETKIEFREFAASMTPVQLEELGEFYNRATTAESRKKLEEWLMLVAAVPQSEDEKKVRRLVAVFGHLGRLSIKAI